MLRWVPTHWLIYRTMVWMRRGPLVEWADLPSKFLGSTSSSPPLGAWWSRPHLDLTQPPNLWLLPESSSFDLSLTSPPPYFAGGRCMFLTTVMAGCVLPVTRIHWTMAPAAANHRSVAADCVFLQDRTTYKNICLLQYRKTSTDKKNLHSHHFAFVLLLLWRRTLRTKSSLSLMAKLPIVFVVLPWPASALVRLIASRTQFTASWIGSAALVSSSV